MTLPAVGGPGQAQIIATKSLVIYGNGRNAAATLPTGCLASREDRSWS